MSFRLFLALIAAAAAIPAQTGSIAGVVREAGSGAPLANVSVSAGGWENTTDAQGRFRFSSQDPGAKRVYASDKALGVSASASVVVRAGEEATVEIRLTPGGSISGRVMDSTRKPVPNAAVLLLQRRYQFGDIAYAPVQTTATDENGVYRFDRVSAEKRFLVLAKKRLNATAPGELPPYEERERVLMPALYGDSPDVAGAQMVAVASHERRAGVDIRLADTPGYCVEGVVDAAVKEAFVSFTERLPFDAGWMLTPATVRANAEGAFRACGLHPGEYRLMATNGPPGNTLNERVSGWAATAVAWGSALLFDKDVRSLQLSERTSAAIGGDAVYDPAPQEKAGPASISVSRDVSGDDFADSTEKKSGEGVLGGGLQVGGRPTTVPGPFSLGRLRAGEWQLRVSRLAAGCYVKSATYGQQNLLRGFLRVGEEGGPDRVRLSIACDGGSLTARVTDTSGNPVPDAILYLFDQESSGPGEMAASLHRTQVMSGWSVPLTALRPGKYLALAATLDASGDGSADDVEALWSLRSEAKPVEIAPGAMAQLSMTCTIASAPRIRQ
jgi:hypothetical protein